MLNIIDLILKEIFDEEFVSELNLIKVFQEETKCKFQFDVFYKIEFLARSLSKKFLSISIGVQKDLNYLKRISQIKLNFKKFIFK